MPGGGCAAIFPTLPLPTPDRSTNSTWICPCLLTITRPPTRTTLRAGYPIRKNLKPAQIFTCNGIAFDRKLTWLTPLYTVNTPPAS